jgi:hypothetical protein
MEFFTFLLHEANILNLIICETTAVKIRHDQNNFAAH